VNNNKNYKKLLKRYDLTKLNTKSNELFEIVNKYEFYKCRTTVWYLKPFYEFVYILSVFIARCESKHALRK
jgi:hypothetical protein